MRMYTSHDSKNTTINNTRCERMLLNYNNILFGKTKTKKKRILCGVRMRKLLCILFDCDNINMRYF